MEIVETWFSKILPLVFSSTHCKFKDKASYYGLALRFTNQTIPQQYLFEIGRCIAKSCILGKLSLTSRNQSVRECWTSILLCVIFVFKYIACDRAQTTFQSLQHNEYHQQCTAHLEGRMGILSKHPCHLILKQLHQLPGKQKSMI